MMTRHPVNGSTDRRIPAAWSSGVEQAEVIMGERISKSPATTSTIGIRVPAELDQLVMLRAIAETIALIGDFALDEVTDIRVAVDEIATALMRGAAPDSELECEFGYNARRMTVRMRVAAGAHDVIDEGGFGWHVLRTITETLAVERDPFDKAVSGYPTTVIFSRIRSDADDG